MPPRAATELAVDAHLLTNKQGRVRQVSRGLKMPPINNLDHLSSWRPLILMTGHKIADLENGIRLSMNLLSATYAPPVQDILSSSFVVNRAFV